MPEPEIRKTETTDQASKEVEFQPTPHATTEAYLLLYLVRTRKMDFGTACAVDPMNYVFSRIRNLKVSFEAQPGGYENAFLTAEVEDLEGNWSTQTKEITGIENREKWAQLPKS